MSIDEKNFSVAGMHCAACSSRIERVIGSQPGVERASVNLAAETMVCRFENEENSTGGTMEKSLRL